MELKVLRYSDNGESTLGLLFIDGEFECYTLEDEYREIKIKHETRVPDGTYGIEYRTVGGFHERYKTRYGNLHKGMLHVQDVPGFEYILIHSGNNDDHTSGCLLVGNTANNNKIQDGFIGDSRTAYKKLYRKVSRAIESGESITITYETNK
jgi:hypothetical protein